MAINYSKLTRIEKRSLFEFANRIPKDPSKVCPVILMKEINDYAEEHEDDPRYSKLFHKILHEMVGVMNHIITNPMPKVWESLSSCVVTTDEARMAKKIIKICMFEQNTGDGEISNVLAFPGAFTEDTDEDMSDVA